MPPFNMPYTLPTLHPILTYTSISYTPICIILLTPPTLYTLYSSLKSHRLLLRHNTEQTNSSYDSQEAYSQTSSTYRQCIVASTTSLFTLLLLPFLPLTNHPNIALALCALNTFFSTLVRFNLSNLSMTGVHFPPDAANELFTRAMEGRSLLMRVMGGLAGGWGVTSLVLVLGREYGVWMVVADVMCGFLAALGVASVSGG